MTDAAARAGDAFATLVRIMDRLRTPETGCPWDLEQSFETIAPYTIEEAYEVADAIERGDLSDLKGELGDLAFQVVFHARMASEAGSFDAADVIGAISDKMIRRHPHVFADADARDAEEQTRAWEAQKAAERASRKGDAPPSSMDDVARALPAALRAQKLQNRAARDGFDWPDARRVLDKLEEEFGEVREALDAGDQAGVAEEVGDLLFVCVNLARKLGVDAEAALKAANAKFEARYRLMEDTARAEGTAFETLDLDAQEALWNRAKAALKVTR